MSGYISDLRKIVGRRTLIQCAASIICVNEKGQLLLGKRTDNHLWGYSGGAVEVDEHVEDCARRELLEEMSITAGKMELFYINSIDFCQLFRTRLNQIISYISIIL